jgi:transcriptional regulator with XRE-family HTH domain
VAKDRTEPDGVDRQWQPNMRLKRQMTKAGYSILRLHNESGVSERTIGRYLSGESANPRRGEAETVAGVLGCSVGDLWPELELAGHDIIPVGVFPSRADIPVDFWRRFFNEAKERIDLCVFGGTFLYDALPGFNRMVREAADRGVTVRFAVGDPGSSAVHQRGIEEGIGDSLASRCRMTLNRVEPIAGHDNVEIRTHGMPLYVSMFRADDLLIANHHILGSPASNNPALVFCRDDAAELWELYQTSYEHIWSKSRPVTYPI